MANNCQFLCNHSYCNTTNDFGKIWQLCVVNWTFSLVNFFCFLGMSKYLFVSNFFDFSYFESVVSGKDYHIFWIQYCKHTHYFIFCSWISFYQLLCDTQDPWWSKCRISRSPDHSLRNFCTWKNRILLSAYLR